MSTGPRVPHQGGPAARSLLADACALRAAHLTDGYGLAYGSHTDGGAGATSDLDLLLVGDEPLTAEQVRALTGDVIGLHRRHGLALDQEVSYESKLHATTGQVERATALGGFTATAEGDIVVDPVVVEPWFLNSAPFKLRLTLNALTVPHVFLGGDLALYDRHRLRAERAVALLALSLLEGHEEFTAGDAAAALLGRPPQHGEDFLGYDERACRPAALFGLLQRALAALEQEGAVSTGGGVRLRQYPERRRQLVLELAAQVAGA
ncbi:nucleotidyltransferase domain-containing protein [Kitasatospora purpeofusca]|uniref:nucleotidyltransferase domain-containing protein n=1 Tax=Kitasatospora purpeofusca TaxID=67352 RepID=UPI0036BC6B28